MVSLGGSNVNRNKLCVALLALAALIVTPVSAVVNFNNKVSIGEGNPLPPLPPSILTEGNPLPPLPPAMVAEGNPLPPLPPVVVAEGNPLPPLPPTLVAEGNPLPPLPPKLTVVVLS
jgi:hypothetical protein